MLCSWKYKENFRWLFIRNKNIYQKICLNLIILIFTWANNKNDEKYADKYHKHLLSTH